MPNHLAMSCIGRGIFLKLFCKARCYPERRITSDRIFIFFLLLSFLAPAFANSAPFSLGRDIPYSVLEDPKGELSVDEASEQLRERPMEERSTLSRGYVRDTFWLRFDLPGAAFEGQQRWLELGPAFVDDIRVFIRPEGSSGPWLSKRTGDVMLGQSDLDYRKAVFIVPPPPADTTGYEMIVRVQSSSTTILQATLWQPAELLAEATRSTSFWSFYLGLATLSTLLALVLAVILGGSQLWSATAFSISFLLVAAIQGYVNWVFPVAALPLQHYLTSVATLLAYGAMLWLCAETLNLKHDLPRAYKALITLSTMILSLLVLIPFDMYSEAIAIQTALYLLGAVIFFGSVFYLWWQAHFRLTVLLLGAAPMVCMLGSLSAVFSTLGFIPFRTEVYVIWQYSLIALILLVTATAVYRVRERKLKELEDRQLASELKAERDASFHQRQFMGMVSHEFRTPLAVISGSLENLWHLEESGASSARGSRYDKIRRATDRLVLLSDNCLSDARLAADNLYIDPQPVSLMDVIHSAAELVGLSGNQKLVITVNGHPADTFEAQDDIVELDVALVRIALSNVIDNAVKHSIGERIYIECSIHNRNSVIRVRDEGPGINSEDAGWIFERYRRGASGRGVGLGLYIARQICVGHGGDLRLVSAGPDGNCFEFTFNTGEEIGQ